VSGARASALVLPAALAAAVGEGVLWAGGYAPAPRIVFALLAAVALAAALHEDRRAAVVLLRRPAVVTLLALGALGALSALWTVGGVGYAVRWGAVAGGYAAVAVAAGVLARRPGGPLPIAVGIAVLAAVCAVVGLAGVLARTGPFADHESGAWRAGGTLEYSAALALLQVSALPVLLRGLGATRARWRWSAGVAGLLAVVVLWRSASRLEVAMAAAVLIAWLGWVRPAARRAAVGRGARTVLIAGVVALGVGVATAVVAAWTQAPTGLWHGRLDVWRTALDVFADRPLGGAGADAFLVASLPHVTHGDPVTFAHDLPLELAAELGVGGAVLAVVLYAGSVREVWRARSTQAGWLLGPAVVAFLVASLLDWPWHLAGSGAVWAAALGGVATGGKRFGAMPQTGNHGARHLQ
jgi:hypothetical protein